MTEGKFTDKLKESADKLKESISFHDLESFRHKYATEIFIVVALAVGAISSAWDFFTGPKLTIFVLALGVIGAIFFPEPVQKVVKKMYGFAQSQENTTQIVLGVVQIVVGIFIPFVLFGVFGLMAGLSFHYYTHQAQMAGDDNSSKPSKHMSDDQD